MATMQANTPKPTESVCVQTERIYDSCKSKECAEDLRVYFSPSVQALVDTANNVKLKCAQVLYVSTDVEKIQFNKCYYNVNITFFFKVTVEVSSGCSGSVNVDGLCVYCKNAMLFGSEGCSYVFSSRDNEYTLPTLSRNANMPTAVVETVDPVALDAKLTEFCPDCGRSVRECTCSSGKSVFPNFVSSVFPEGVVDDCVKRVYVTLGLFTFIRLQRSTQLLIPSYDFCIPQKNCIGAGCGDDPCTFFEKLEFPIDAFFPPSCCNDSPVYTGGDNSSCGANGYVPSPEPSNGPLSAAPKNT